MTAVPNAYKLEAYKFNVYRINAASCANIQRNGLCGQLNEK